MSDGYRDNFDQNFGEGGGGRGRWSEMPPSRRNAPTMEIGPDTVFDYKDSHALSAFITDRGKIIPRRVSGLTSKQQRQLTIAIKRARNIALLP